MESSVDEIRGVVFETLRASLAKPIELSDQTNIVRDLGLDSVAVMDFVMEIEDRLDISIPVATIAEARTLDQLCAGIRRLTDLP